MYHHLKLKSFIKYDINWNKYYMSKNPNAIKLLKLYPDRINWYWLSENSNAMELLEANKDKIVWSCLSLNKSIFSSYWAYVFYL